MILIGEEKLPESSYKYVFSSMDAVTGRRIALVLAQIQRLALVRAKIIQNGLPIMLMFLCRRLLLDGLLQRG
jgi:hypothetical protein